MVGRCRTFRGELEKKDGGGSFWQTGMNSLRKKKNTVKPGSDMKSNWELLRAPEVCEETMNGRKRTGAGKMGGKRTVGGRERENLKSHRRRSW